MILFGNPLLFVIKRWSSFGFDYSLIIKWVDMMDYNWKTRIKQWFGFLRCFFKIRKKHKECMTNGKKNFTNLKCDPNTKSIKK